ncbi:MAG: acetyl-CoA decarbonylase/synthase complex subunit gamma [Candidatus Omnitrophota bacterium]
MALSGLDIYKLLPKTNCKECGFATCLAFAMALAQKKVSLDKCPHVTAQAREALESASQPPVKLVTIGAGEAKTEIGNETVMYRHEQKFYHPGAVGFLMEDTLPATAIDERLGKIEGLRFERVGQVLKPEIICLKNSSGKRDPFLGLLKKAMSASRLAIALYTDDAVVLEEALKLCGPIRPLVIWDDDATLEKAATIAKNYRAALAISAGSVEEAAALTDRVRKSGVDEIVINIKGKGLSDTIQDFTLIRRTALKKNFRPLGYPVMAFTGSSGQDQELAEAVSYILKYAGIVIVKNIEKEFVFPLLVARQDIYTDPQKPVQVEPRIYEIGKVSTHSPVLVTTNFSITYFTVAGEVESSKVPSYVICCDAEGMSVLTAWAAEKFTAERITDTIAKSGIGQMVSHKRIVLPGYVAVLSSKLEELSGWNVQVGPREASGIPAFLKGWK